MKADYYERELVTGEIYHVFNRGVAKQPLFLDERDYQHGLEILGFYMEQDPGVALSSLIRAKTGPEALRQLLVREPDQPLVEIIAYTLMPNHFHLVIKQLVDGGISQFMRRSMNSFTRYHNVRHERVGPMFQGVFRFVRVTSDEQLLHLTRYVHLNPFAAQLTNDPERYPWFSYPHYRHGTASRLCHPDQVIALAGSPERYRSFLLDFADYTYNRPLIQDLI